MPTATREEVIWQPDAETISSANATRFMAAHGITTYSELLARSQQRPDWFWDAVVKHIGLEFTTPYSAVVDASDPPFATWFVGGRTNLASNCVHRHALGMHANRTAIIWEGEDEGVRRLSYADLRRDVSLLASSLTQLGIGQGDRVALYLPMVPEVAIAFYACAAIGAIAVPIFSGFAAPAVASRLQHSEARVVICADGTLRRGKQVPMKTVVDEAVADSPTVQHVLVWRRLGIDVQWNESRDHWWHQLTADADASFAPLELDSEHPLMLAYTSGTTGKPKAAVHVHGGFLAKIAQEAHFQTDLHAGEVLHWVTDMGWIMGPWELVGTHANGGTLLLYEGAPDYPGPDRLWSLVERHKVNVLGVSPTLIRALQAQGDDHVERHDVTSLRVLASTGEPWNPDPYMWLFEKVGGSRCPIINVSGGTEVGCFLAPSPLTPLKPCTLGGPVLGISMEVRASDGNALGPGEGVGELVCTKPWPAMTRGFWGEGGRERYLETYWSRWPGVWVHGDWASIDADGLWFLHGRSDDTMNIAGKRIGPAEFESILVNHEAVVESAAVGVPHEVKGEAVWCFVVLAHGRRASERLRGELRDMVIASLGKAFAPSEIKFVRALPRTRSAKIVRRAIKAAALGTELGDTSTIENPESLKAIAEAS